MLIRHIRTVMDTNPCRSGTFSHSAESSKHLPAWVSPALCPHLLCNIPKVAVYIHGMTRQSQILRILRTLKAHRAWTVGQMRSQGTVLCIQDGSDLNYGKWPGCERLQIIGRDAGNACACESGAQWSRGAAGVLRCSFEAAEAGPEMSREAAQSERSTPCTARSQIMHYGRLPTQLILHRHPASPQTRVHNHSRVQ